MQLHLRCLSVWCRLVSDDLRNAVVCLQGLGTCDAHLCLSLTLQSSLESGQEAEMGSNVILII